MLAQPGQFQGDKYKTLTLHNCYIIPLRSALSVPHRVGPELPLYPAMIYHLQINLEHLCSFRAPTFLLYTNIHIL